MVEQEAIAQVVTILERLGRFEVKRIPPSNEIKRPDLLVRYGQEVHLIEQKTKGDDPTECAEELEDLKFSKIIDRSKELQPRSRLSGLIRGALDQIEAYPDAGNAYKLVWFTLWGAWHRVNADSIFKGVYGLQHVLDVDDHSTKIHDCLYFGFSDFQRYKEIDAIIVKDGDSLQVLVNEFSPRYTEFMKSHLVSVFREGVYDPKEVIAKGGAYSLKDYPGDRKNQGACLIELAGKLGVKKMLVMPMSEIHVISNLDGPSTPEE
jgi:hypothetical protein